MSTYEVKCEAGKHVFSFTAAELKDKFGAPRAADFIDDPENYPLRLRDCGECRKEAEQSQSGSAPFPSGTDFLRPHNGLTA